MQQQGGAGAHAQQVMGGINENDLEFIKLIGQGAFGKVYYARRRATGEAVAVKMIDRQLIQDQATMNSILAEMQILAQIRHPNIVRFHGSYETQKALCIVESITHESNVRRNSDRGR